MLSVISLVRQCINAIRNIFSLILILLSLAEKLHAKGGPVSYRDRKFNTEFMRIVGEGAKDLGYTVIDPSAPRKIGKISSFKSYWQMIWSAELEIRT